MPIFIIPSMSPPGKPDNIRMIESEGFYQNSRETEPPSLALFLFDQFMMV
jgi:hypothetical protein